MENKKKELLKPKYDVVFQALFGENKENIFKTTKTWRKLQRLE